MADPLPKKLFDSLDYIFNVAAVRNEKFTITAIQELKEAKDLYNPEDISTFITLRDALEKAIPYIEIRGEHFNSIRKAMDTLAKSHNKPSINWDEVLAHPNVSPKFQFSAHHSGDLISWLKANTEKPFEEVNLLELLLENRGTHGFGLKLKDYLKKNPDFLYDLIIKSEDNFNAILNTRISLYLTDQQIVLAIFKYNPILSQQKDPSFEEVEQIVNKLNKLLTYGRSVSTLLRNAEVKPYLEVSEFFQVYQSDEFKNRFEQQPPTPLTP